MVDADRLQAALETARCDLLAEAHLEGHWRGDLGASPLATAVTVAALAIYERHFTSAAAPPVLSNLEAARLSKLVMAGVRALAKRQNADGGWGDTFGGPSNLRATALARMAFHLTGVPAQPVNLLDRVDAYLAAQGGTSALRRAAKKGDLISMFAVTGWAVVGLLPWRKVPASLAAGGEGQPQLLVDRLPAAIGARLLKAQSGWLGGNVLRLPDQEPRSKCLAELEGAIQPRGGTLADVVLTSFAVLFLVAAGCGPHSLVHAGVEFLVSAARTDATWPIDGGHAVEATAQVLAVLGRVGEPWEMSASREWLLAAQHQDPHPLTDAPAGGWSSTSTKTAAPNTTATAAAVSALAQLGRTAPPVFQPALASAAQQGLLWLLDMQNPDGGWPTFTRAESEAPGVLERSAVDPTSDAIGAIVAWSDHCDRLQTKASSADLRQRTAAALHSAARWLFDHQQADGSWLPLWFVKPDCPDQPNAVVGTSKALVALADLKQVDAAAAHRGVEWLVAQQLPSGAWPGTGATGELDQPNVEPELVETAIAAYALLRCAHRHEVERAANRGVAFLVDSIEIEPHHHHSTIRIAPVKLTYGRPVSELTAVVAALAETTVHRSPDTAPHPVVAIVKPSA